MVLRADKELYLQAVYHWLFLRKAFGGDSDNNTYEKGYTYLGIVGAPNEKGLYRMEQRNKFSVGEQIEIMKPNGDNVLATVLALVDEDGNEMESCPHPQQVFYVKLSETPDEFDILRRQENEAIALD